MCANTARSNLTRRRPITATALVARAIAERVPLVLDADALNAIAADPELAAASKARLAEITGRYSDISVGAAYLSSYPTGEHAEQVATRLNTLADNLYGEVVLYQSLGDHLKAIERMQKILTSAPASPAAAKLLERVVLPT